MSTSSPDPPKRRWPGLLLSLLVPGFGLVRAGLPGRGVGWLIGLQFASLIGGLSIGLGEVPLMGVIVFLVVAMAVQIWMLGDSFRPGKMTGLLWLLFFVLAAVIVWLPSPASWVARAFVIPTGNMEPTLLGPKSAETPDHVIVDRVSYRFGSPQRGDLIVFFTSQIPAIPPGADGKGVFYIKRLVGLPGERIRIADGKIHANGRLLGESDGIPPLTFIESEGYPSSARRDGQDYVVGPDEYFVLGDNSSNSSDSRHWGCVPASAVYGKVTLIYYPFGRAGRLGQGTIGK